MRAALRIAGVGISCVVVAIGVVGWMTGLDGWWKPAPDAITSSAGSEPVLDVGLQKFPDPNAPGTRAQVFAGQGFPDTGIFETAYPYTGTISDTNSLDELREAVRGRGRRGLTALRTQYDRLSLDSPPTLAQLSEVIPLARSVAFLYMYEGKFSEAASWFGRALELSRRPGISPDVQANMHVLLGIAALRRGEIENCLECVGPSSCIFPIDREAAHLQQAGSREAVKHFLAYLDLSPGDLHVRWLLNLAYMTLGEYPEQVPGAYLIVPGLFGSTLESVRFENIAIRAGLGARGPNLAGGSIFDDFNGDGLADLLTTSIDADLGASLFVNRNDGTFEDHSAASGLTQQIYALNLSRTDFDNDGNLDVLLLRGAWEHPLRLSLLRNKGGGVFVDVTIAGGMSVPISSESAVWGDYDNDGLVDLFVCGEHHGDATLSGEHHGDPSKDSDRSRLYHNQGNGTFKDVAVLAGIVNNRVAKGSAWGDYDADGRLDLFVSNMDGPCRLYHNEGNGRFQDVARELGVAGLSTDHSFACWFWDFDNDGRLDLFVANYNQDLATVLANYLGLPVSEPGCSHLYKNVGPDGFRDVATQTGFTWSLSAMGANFGDIDNDGYLDAYFGTGWMSYSGLIPNIMVKNIDGNRFEDITSGSGTGHLQKGHGISFADWDNDGDLDLFAVLGGAYPGDQAYNVLFQNPGHSRRWLKVKLIGTKTNRSALGAKIQVELKDASGGSRSIYRTVGNNGSFGGNSLVELVGLRDAKVVDRLTVSWPTSHSTQTFRNIDADQSIEITEGSDFFKVLHQPPITPPPAKP